MDKTEYNNKCFSLGKQVLNWILGLFREDGPMTPVWRYLKFEQRNICDVYFNHALIMCDTRTLNSCVYEFLNFN